MEVLSLRFRSIRGGHGLRLSCRKCHSSYCDGGQGVVAWCILVLSKALDSLALLLTGSTVGAWQVKLGWRGIHLLAVD